MNTRRQWMKNAGLGAAAAKGFPAIVGGAALGLNGAVAASDRVTLAIIGVGGMGTGHINEFAKVAAARVVAVCDVDEEHLAAAKAKVDQKYANTDCATFRAYDEVLARTDIDAVSLALPDHWHGLVAVLAARARKDIYGEKPLAHNFREGLAICESVRKYGRIWQTGSWQRSRPQFHQACELVRNGRAGKVKRVEVGLPGGPFEYKQVLGKMDITEPPKTLNYDRWLGPSPEVPYIEGRVHFHWRWNLDTGGGQLMDWVGHHVDIAHWGLGFDHTGPLSIEGQGEYPSRDELWNSARRYRLTAKYEGGIEMVIAGGHSDIRSGTKWIGDEGWIWVDRSGIQSEPASLLTSQIGPNEIHLVKSAGHYQQFIECVRSRGLTLTPADVAHRSATLGWLGQIAMLTGRKIHWDPANQRIQNDREAEKLLSREMRLPWRL
ncbi:MAG: Gfo/Idh/MocA family protein [Bryobacteraceae bacterium]